MEQMIYCGGVEGHTSETPRVNVFKLKISSGAAAKDAERWDSNANDDKPVSSPARSIKY